MDFVLGIDGGGTSCRAAVARADGVVLGRAKAGAANIRTDLTGARTSIVEAARRAFAEAGQDPDLVSRTPAVLGLAGANVGTYRQQLQAILPFSRSRVETDAEIALEGAVGAGDGAMAILGTGSAYMVRKGGKSRAIGGWGFQVGDQGSGARVGRDLLEQTLLAYDGIREASPLTREMLAVFRDRPEDVVEFTTNAKPGDFGGFAPKVFDYAQKGDAVAVWIVDRAVADVEAALGALDLSDDAPLCLLGGLAPLYASRLSQRFRRLLREPLGDALSGAVRMAARAFASPQGGGNS
ncbi:BadF/BadG/BcrA/BcrD ATPase family protein [Aquamicrobium soli]|uniref:BadF/BadG/BcrA/BcrD ATPase family protein n=1 Tax=Aquamicrobium soli TaxID=1811518 RepID=A0ABV7KIS3_9HYPH